MEKQYIMTPSWGSTHSMSAVIDDDQIFYGKENLRLARSQWRRQERFLLGMDLSGATHERRHDYETELTKTRWAIAHLKTLISRAESRPVLPTLRPDNWFKPGDQVVCWLNSRDPYKPVAETGFSYSVSIGRVERIDEFRQVVVDLKGPTSNGFYCDCSYSHHHILKHVGFSPFILHEAEYRTLTCVSSDEYLKLWCSYAHPGDLDELKLFLS